MKNWKIMKNLILKQGSRSSVPNEDRSKQLDDEPKDFSIDQQDLGPFQIDLFANRLNSVSTPAVLLMDSRSICRSYECSSTTMAQDESLGKSAMDFDSSNISKIDTGKGYVDNSSSFLEISSMVPSTSTAFNFSSNSVTNTKSLCSSSSSPARPITQSKMESPRVQNLRTRYEEKGFSEKTINLFI